MKKSLIGFILLIAVMTTPAIELKAQWLTTGNALGGAGLFGSTNNNSYSLISNNTQRIRIMSNGNIQLGSNAVLNNTPTNYAQFDEDGDLRFFGTGSYLVPSNSYAFRWEGDEDIGLFFNATLARYEFRDNTANAVFHVTSGGDVHTLGELDLDGNLNVGTDGSVKISTTGPSDAKLHIEGGEFASLTSSGMLVLGPEQGYNLTFDNTDIMARNNGIAASLSIQRYGGNTIFGNSSVPDLMIWQSTGRVGIRTPGPARELEVLHRTGSGSSYGLMISNEGINNQDWTLYTTDNDGDLMLYQNGVFAGEFSDFDGIYTPSDARLKTNVKDIGGVMDRIMKLEPKTFNYIKSEKPEQIHIGFIAQEMEKQFPEIVGRAGEDQDTYVMNYSMLSVLTVKAIQEQQEMIEDQKSEIEALKNEMEALKALVAPNGTTSNSFEKSGAPQKENILYQNQPNPFSGKTTIRVYLNEEVDNAFIRISSLKGEAISTIPVSGQGDVEVSADGLPSGSYFYSLIIDGKVIDSKKMIVAD